MRIDAKIGLSMLALGASSALAVLCASAAILGAAPLQQPAWRDRSGNMVVRNFTSVLVEESPSESGRFVFRFLGKPLIAEWRKQMLRLETNQLEGTAATTGPGAISLATARLTGGVLVSRQSRSAASPTELQELSVSAHTADYLAMEEKWTFGGKVALKRSDPAAGQIFTLQGTSATAFLYPPDSASAPRGIGVKAATVSGPVTFSLSATRSVKSTTDPSKVEKREYTTKGRCDKVEYDNESGELTLAGNVHLEGDDPALFGGEMDAANAVVTLDQAGRIRMIRASGEPGVTRVKQPPPNLGARSLKARPAR